jgi:serine/threonine protein phosphatase 1
MRYFVLGDIHGDYKSLVKVIRHVRKNGGLNFKRGDRLVQLGDRCDRGPDTFRVNNFFYKLEKRYPGQIICLKGNHEDMMIKAAIGTEPMGFLYNGGPATMASYGCQASALGLTDFGFRVRDCGHLTWLDAQPHWHETEDYLFTHAPIPYEGMGARRKNTNFRDSPEVCFWSYGGDNLEDWVDPDPTTEGKIAVHGHIHGGKWRRADNTPIFPGVRQIGNSFLIDTGAGCGGYLTCLELPAMTQYNSNGEILDGEIE